MLYCISNNVSIDEKEIIKISAVNLNFYSESHICSVDFLFSSQLCFYAPLLVSPQSHSSVSLNLSKVLIMTAIFHLYLQ